MDAIIESLNRRKALNSAMLNSGKSTGSGSGLLLNTSSLQPQRTFKRTTASFSVSRPPMTLLRESKLNSFSQKAQTKYSEGPALLHLRPTASTTASGPVVQRTSMPLPVPGAAAVPASDFQGSVPLSSAAQTSNASPFPPKSERKPVTFEKSDGPSDFEKRLMAAKKQKAEQEAKKRPPSRQFVRTEKIEVSPNTSSGEIQREFVSDPVVNSDPLKKKAENKAAVVQRESAAPDTKDNTSAVSAVRSASEVRKSVEFKKPVPAAPSVSRVSGETEFISEDHKTTPDLSGIVQREPVPSVNNTQKSVQRNERTAQENLKAAAQVRREMAPATTVPSSTVVAETSNDAVIRREVDEVPDKPSQVEQAPLPQNMKQNKPAEPVIQREVLNKSAQKSVPSTPLLRAEPILVEREADFSPEKTEQQQVEPTVQREYEPVHQDGDTIQRASEISSKHAPQNRDKQITETEKPARMMPDEVRREFHPETDKEDTGKQAKSDTVQRETENAAKSVQPVLKAPLIQKPDATKGAPELIQREFSIPSEPLQEMTAEKNTVQRESVPSQPDHLSDIRMSENDRIQPALSAEKQIKPEVVSAKEIKNSSGEKSVPEANVIRREIGIPDAALSAPKVHRNDDEHSASLPVQARPVTSTDNTVQREAASSNADKPADNNSSESLADLLKRVPAHYEMPAERIESIRKNTANAVSKKADTVQREMQTAAPVSSHKESSAAPSMVLPAKPKPSAQEKPESAKKSQPFGTQPARQLHSSASSSGAEQKGNRKMSYSNAKATADFFASGNTGVIQREMMDNIPQPKQQAQTPVKEPTSSVPAEEEEVEKKLDMILPEVTNAQLDTLADRLLPRIKRIMRAEMERSIFR